MKNELMAQIFSEAQPYVRKYRGKTVVVKYGGNAMVNDELKAAVMSDLNMLVLMGIRVVLVHGGGPAINKMLDKIGKKSTFINGLRYTDEETMEVVQGVLAAGKVNKDLVALINTLGGKALGMCGMDGNLLICEKHQSADVLGYVGHIKSINTDLIEMALDKGFIPVVATVGVDEDGVSYNVNADTAASEIAIALGASKLISMTDVAGILKNRDDDGSLIPEIEIDQLNVLISEGIISGGMIPKIEKLRQSSPQQCDGSRYYRRPRAALHFTGDFFRPWKRDIIL